METDTSFYNTKDTDSGNPLETISNLAALQGKLKGNRLLDTQNQIAQQTLDQSQVETHLKHFDAFNKMMAPLANDPDLNQQKMLRTGMDLVAQGIIDIPTLNQDMQTWGEDTPEANRKIVQGHLFNNLSAQDQYLQRYGATEKITNGAGTVVGTAASPMMQAEGIPAFQGNSFVPTKTSPEQKMLRTSTIVNGARGSVPQGEQFDDYGNVKGQPSPQGAPTDNAEQAAKDDADLQAAVGNGAPKGFNQTEFAPGYEQRIKDSQSRIAQVREEATPAAANASVLDKIYNLSRNGVETGNTKAFWNEVKNTLAANGVTSDKMSNESATFAELQKYMAQSAQGAGARSDKELDQFLKANPSDKMLPETIQNVTRFLLANVQGKIAKQNAMNKAVGNGLDPDKEEAFKNKWDKIYDPRAIELSLVPPNDRDDYLKKLGKERAKKVIDSYREMRKLGAFE